MKNSKKNWGGELSDVLTFVIHLANSAEINLDEAVKKKLGELEKRASNN